MTLFLTSSPTGPLDNSRPVHGIDMKNGLRENLRKYWTKNARCLLVSAAPSESAWNDQIGSDMRYLLEESGFSCGAMDVWDDRLAVLSPLQVCGYDVVILGGGHVLRMRSFIESVCGES